MRGLMGSCLSLPNRKPRRELTIAVLGLDNAGKTLATKALQGVPITNGTAPTVGFQREELKFGNYDLTFYDLGGGEKIRNVWKHYFAEVYGIVYVVDSGATSRMEESMNVFSELLQHPKVAGKPVLLLANKQDIEGALDEGDICEQMHIEEVVNQHKCPCRVELCSVMKGTGQKMDRSIKVGLRWLCDIISADWGRLQPRVTQDMTEQKEQKRREMAAKKERVAKIRAERERQEAAEKERLGEDDKEEEESNAPFQGDPFKRLDYDQLKIKEAEEKRKRKEQKAMQHQSNNSNNNPYSTVVDIHDANNSRGNIDSDDYMSGRKWAVRSPESPFMSPDTLPTEYSPKNDHKKRRKKKKPLTSPTSYDSCEGTMGESTKSLRTISKIHITPKDEYAGNHDDEVDFGPITYSHRLNKDAQSSVDRDVRRDGHVNKGLDMFEDDSTVRHSKHLQSLDGENSSPSHQTKHKKKRKKKKLKRNKLSPKIDADDSDDTPRPGELDNHRSRPLVPLNKAFPLSPVRENGSPQSWSVLDDFTTMKQLSMVRHYRPNQEEDDSIVT